MLHVKNLDAYYGKIHAVRNVSFQVDEGQVVALLGRNGAGKSTLAKALMGLVDRGGSVAFSDQETIEFESHQLARLGFGYVPENRDIFPTLTVRENLLVGAKPGQKDYEKEADAFLERFPHLKARANIKARVLSGGEQQILTICRTLMGRPRFMIVDEPTEGLAPQIVQQIKELLSEVARKGVTIMIIEQKLSIALSLAQYFLLMGQGSLVFHGKAEDLRANPAIVSEWLTV